MVNTPDTPDMLAYVANIQYNVNLMTFMYWFLLGVAWTFFLCYILYKFFKNCS